ncbi:MAG TPA: zinc metallopeptidase [Candidatus Acidoferrales bacterium]|jgi:Zn-dependent membrane protease YugP|nr:zinc metallopeptidase [Candidatus Acidoferrales bacterium]
MIGWNTNYVLFVMLPGLLIGLWAQMKLHSAYGKYSRVPVGSGMTGAEAARHILDRAGLTDMPVEEVEGHLSDHFDPAKRALFLSSENYHGNTIAAVGVAAHEAGHALQQQAGYGMFNLRMALVPITQIASYAWMGILLAGMFLHLSGAMLIVVAIFAVLTLFQLITLPVEYDASARAKEQLFRLGLVRETEREGVSKVLDAAALTYVAALVGSVLQLFYYVSAASNDDRS